MPQVSRRLRTVYQKLYATFGAQHWWPGDSAFEVIVGAVLTQNTNWQNVEKAINNLKEADKLSQKAILSLSDRKLGQMIKPSGYFNLKARRLKAVVLWYAKKKQTLTEERQKQPLQELRQELLAVYGVGEETADSIILYALERPSFVVDAYSRRIFSRLGIVAEKSSYSEIQHIFTSNLPKKLKLYNEYHALIVCLGKNFCKPKPLCKNCPLQGLKHDVALLTTQS